MTNTEWTDDCPNRARNNQQCPCLATDCKNHGKCCDCIANHRESNSLVYCMKQIRK